MKKIKNIFGKILVILFVIFLAGSVYFVVYNKEQIDSPLANFFLFAGFFTFVIAIINSRNNIKEQLKQGYSPANSGRTVQALIYLVVGGIIINFISSYISGSFGFTIGLILSACLFGGLFLFFKNKKK